MFSTLEISEESSLSTDINPYFEIGFVAVSPYVKRYYEIKLKRLHVIKIKTIQHADPRNLEQLGKTLNATRQYSFKITVGKPYRKPRCFL